MRIVLDITKSIDENASDYFESAKRARKKSKGVDKALEVFHKQRNQVIKKQTAAQVAHARKAEPYQPTHWYEKFRWFTSSDGALCIGGRDATQNEILIKKHLDTDDLVFHTDIPGSPFFVVKNEGNTLTPATYEQAAQATLSYSKAWKLGMQSAEVFSVTPEQISKTAQSGEYLTKGSFMIRGKRTYYRPQLGIAIGVHDGIIIAGPPAAIQAQSERIVNIQPGQLKASEAAKQIKNQLDQDCHLDDIIRFLPPGKVDVVKERR